jgi:L-ribulose-5-phosphate 4-epimerase
MHLPGVIVCNHGPFTWGKSPSDAIHNAVVLEEVAMMAYHAHSLAGDISSIDQTLLDKHFLRKHGVNAYYGQK